MTRIQPKSRTLATIDCAATLREAADRMRRDAVGTLMVTKAGRPAGLLTDRDLLVRGVVARRDAARDTVDQVMSQPLLTASADEPLERLVERMAEHGVRRLPLVTSGGEPAGMVSLDDVVVALANELDAVAAAFRRSDWDAQRRRRWARPRGWLQRRLGRALARSRRGRTALRRAWARLAQ